MTKEKQLEFLFYNLNYAYVPMVFIDIENFKGFKWKNLNEVGYNLLEINGKLLLVSDHSLRRFTKLIYTEPKTYRL